MGSSPVFVYDQNDNDREPIPVQMVVSRLSFGLFDRDSIAIATATEPQLNNQQRTSMLVSVDFHGVQSQHIISRSSIRFEWSSWRRIHLTTTFRIPWISITLFMEHDNKLNSNSNLNAMPQPQLNSNHQQQPLHWGSTIQTRSSIRFEWNGRLGVEFDHGQGAARP